MAGTTGLEPRGLCRDSFPLQVEKSRLRDNAGREAVFEASRTRTAESLAAERDADVENEPAGISAERAW
jgi:hypothetical protein